MTPRHAAAETAPTHGGYRVPGLDAMAALSPDFSASFDVFAGVPWKDGSLPPFMKALVYVAVNATTTQMNRAGVSAYVRQALELGATPAQVTEVLQLASTIGIHACALGIPVLLDEIDPRGERRALAIAADPERAALKQRFITQRGYWNEVWDGLLWLDPGYFDAFITFSSAPWLSGTLAPKFKELIYIAVDTTTTHLFELGTRIHIRNALQLGATAEEITEVLQLVSAVGVHACALGAPILQQELAARASTSER